MPKLGLRTSVFSFVLVSASLAGCVSDAGPEAIAEEPRVLAPDEIGASVESGGIVKVLVVDPEVVPIKGASVLLEPPKLHAVTDLSGTVGFGPLEPGRYTIFVERKGYEPANAEVQVRDGQTTEVMVEVEPIGRDVPYHQTLIFEAHLLCHIVVTLPPPFAGGLNAPCAAVIDLVASNTSQDAWKFPFTVEHKGFSSLVLQMTWEPQQFGYDGLLQLSTLGTAAVSGSGVTVAGTVYGDTQAPPFYTVLHAGHSYWNGSDGPVIFYPKPNTTENFELLVAGGGGNGTLPLNNAVFLEHRATVYVSLFYNRAATWAFTAVPDQ